MTNQNLSCAAQNVCECIFASIMHDLPYMLATHIYELFGECAENQMSAQDVRTRARATLFDTVDTHMARVMRLTGNLDDFDVTHIPGFLRDTLEIAIIVRSLRNSLNPKSRELVKGTDPSVEWDLAVAANMARANALEAVSRYFERLMGPVTMPAHAAELLNPLRDIANQLDKDARIAFNGDNFISDAEKKLAADRAERKRLLDLDKLWEREFPLEWPLAAEHMPENVTREVERLMITNGQGRLPAIKLLRANCPMTLKCAVALSNLAGNAAIARTDLFVLREDSQEG